MQPLSLSRGCLDKLGGPEASAEKYTVSLKVPLPAGLALFLFLPNLRPIPLLFFFASFINTIDRFLSLSLDSLVPYHRFTRLAGSPSA